MKKIVIASNNLGKLNEIGAILAPLDIEIVPQTSLGVSEAAEPHFTFVENALAKAYHASRATGLPALADDSGICVEALGGAPGVHSARFANENAAGEEAGAPRAREAQDGRNNRKLLDLLAKESNRKAYYYCVIVLTRHPDDPRPLICEAEWRGEIVKTARGSGGFGYDPLFMIDGLGKTGAELPTDEKNRISHRAQALAQLVARLKAELGIRDAGPNGLNERVSETVSERISERVRVRSPVFKSEDEAVRSRIVPSRFKSDRKKP